MSLPRQKALTPEVFTVAYPDYLPRLPDSELERSEGLRTWQKEMDTFWANVLFALSRERETLMQEIEKLKTP